MPHIEFLYNDFLQEYQEEDLLKLLLELDSLGISNQMHNSALDLSSWGAKAYAMRPESILKIVAIAGRM